jgi:hypothetical protein
MDTVDRLVRMLDAMREERDNARQSLHMANEMLMLAQRNLKIEQDGADQIVKNLRRAEAKIKEWEEWFRSIAPKHRANVKPRPGPLLADIPF